VNCDWQLTNLVWHCRFAVGQIVNTDGWHHTCRVGQPTIVGWSAPATGPAGAPARPKAAPGSNAGWPMFAAGLIAGLPHGSPQPPGALGHASTADGHMRVLHVIPAVTRHAGGCVGIWQIHGCVFGQVIPGRVAQIVNCDGHVKRD